MSRRKSLNVSCHTTVSATVSRPTLLKLFDRSKRIGYRELQHVNLNTAEDNRVASKILTSPVAPYNCELLSAVLIGILTAF